MNNQVLLSNDKKHSKYTNEQKEIVIHWYVNERRGQLFCANKANCSVRIVKQILRDNNIKIRNFSEAATVSNMNRSKKKNQDYFNIESENMAWVLGFIASDGNVSKNNNCIKITLSSVDKEILERIKKEINIETDIKDYVTYDGFNNSTLKWSCEEHKQALKEYNIVPNKTCILKPPYKLNRKYWIDYIRGYFDGDGSISYIQSNDSIRWQICSATIEILEFIINYFYEDFNINKVNIQPQNRNGNILYVIQYATKSAIKIFKALYSTNSNLYLKRKKEKFEEIINKKYS